MLRGIATLIVELLVTCCAIKQLWSLFTFCLDAKSNKKVKAAEKKLKIYLRG